MLLIVVCASLWYKNKREIHEFVGEKYHSNLFSFYGSGEKSS